MTMGINPNGEFKRIRVDEEGKLLISGQSIIPGSVAVDSVNGKTGVVTLAKGDVGLGNVDNTSDADKPVSTATQMALNAKANASYTVNLTGNQTVAGVKTFSSSPLVPTATTGTQAVNRTQMSNADAAKVDKVIPGVDSVYRVTSAGVQDTIRYSQTIIFNSIPQRDGEGRLQAASPVGANDVANKTYVDALVPIYGTGFPDGVISAPVGSIYIDTAVTNGASSWIKKSGTGNTGWSIYRGETDVKTITPENGDTGIVSFYRAGNVVTVHASVTIGATRTNPVATLPSGYTPRRQTRASYEQAGATVSKLGQIAANGELGFFTSPTVGSAVTFDRTYITSDPWPTT